MSSTRFFRSLRLDAAARASAQLGAVALMTSCASQPMVAPGHTHFTGTSPAAATASGSPRELVAEPPVAACEQTFLLPFESISWRAAYRGSQAGLFHHCPNWSHFGPVRPNGKWHRGLDIAAPTGTPVRSAVAGTLSYSKDPKGFGLYARVKFRPMQAGGNGACEAREPLEILYAHLQEDSAVIKFGEEKAIPAGFVVGRVGCSGNARGMCSPSPESHVHVSVRVVSEKPQHLDPLTVLRWNPQTPAADQFQPALAKCPI